MGYLTADKDDPNLARKMLIGGATGASIGGLTGALSSGGSKQMADTWRSQGHKAGYEEAMAAAREAFSEIQNASINAGHKAGYREALQDIASKPDMAAEVLEQMNPEARKLIMKKFDKGWLTRLFGG